MPPRVRTELGEIREVAETTARGLDALRAELTGVRESEQRMEAMQAELNFALKSLEELKQGLSSAGQAAVIARREAEQARKAAQHVGDGSTERVTEVFQQILGLAANRNAQNRRATTPTPAPPKEQPTREPRHGFDDVAEPMAILTLDGKFKELNRPSRSSWGTRSTSSRRPRGRLRTTAATTRISSSSCA